MRPISEVTRWLHVVVATLAVWALDRIRSIFDKLDLANYALLATVILAVIGMQVADRLAIGAIDRFRWIRRILSGRNDIEGDWVEVMGDSVNPAQIIRVSYSRIRFQGGRHVLSGDDWTIDGTWIGEYVTTGGANYAGRQLEYYYHIGILRSSGHGIILFSPNDSLPTEFMCKYLDEEAKSMFVAKGRRVATRLRRLDFNKRREAALAFANSFDPKDMPRMM